MPESVFFTSDTHWHHKSILRFGRGEFFDDLDEMNESLIERWNAVVKSGDRVYHLGDFSFGNKAKIVAVLDRLQGQIHMVRGNHDRQLDSLASRFASYGDYKSIRVGDQKIVMSHYPFLTWDQAHHGSWMLHGHSHHLLAPTTQPRLDVGVDGPGYDFTPVSFEQVREIMAGRSYTPVDHHA